MAKLSSINKNERRKKLVKQYAAKYEKLKAIAADESLDETERLVARLKMAELPRNANPTRVRNRCATTGRPRGYYRKFGINRIELRDLGNRGMIPGLARSNIAHHRAGLAADLFRPLSHRRPRRTDAQKYSAKILGRPS